MKHKANNKAFFRQIRGFFNVSCFRFHVSGSSGFTIVELMIAITLMATGIMAIYALVPQGIKTSVVNTDKYLATQLAREGIEVVRNIRDTNWLEQMESPTAAWDEGLTGCAAGCEVDYTTPAVKDPVLTAYGAGRYIKVDGNGLYNYTAGTDTRFKRKIEIIPISGNLQVKSVVSWSADYNDVLLEEILYDWR